jgi:hypothetical protein
MFYLHIILGLPFWIIYVPYKVYLILKDFDFSNGVNLESILNQVSLSPVMDELNYIIGSKIHFLPTFLIILIYYFL